MKNLITYLESFTGLQKFYITISSTLSGFLTYHANLKESLFVLAIVLVLDTITRIHANAKKKGLSFNPFKMYFWKEIESKGFRKMCEKIFLEYGIYIIIAFTLNKYVFNNEVLINFNDKGLTLPVLSIWVFSFIEIWSIAENIEDAGGKNIFKVVKELLPQKIQTLIDNLDKKG